MDTEVLKSFLALAHIKNFRKTASSIHITQAALSLQIQKLEQDLKTRLFTRESKKISLTNEGEIFLAYASSIIDTSQEAKNRFMEPMVTGEIRIGLPEDFASFFLADILKTFSSKHPQLQLSITCDLTINLIESFKNGFYDLIIIKQDPDHKVIDGIPLDTEILSWVASKELIKKTSALNPMPLVVSPNPCVYRKRGIDALNQNQIEYKISYMSASYQGNMAATRAGLGITILPKNMIPQDLIECIGKSFPPLHEVELTLVSKENETEASACFNQHLKQFFHKN